MDPILCLRCTNIGILSNFLPPGMHQKVQFMISDQFLACETRKSDPKMKNGEKSDFWGQFFRGSADFGPHFWASNVPV